MQVIRAKTAGFCMGVDLALKKLDATIANYPNRRIVTLGPIIHNPHVLRDYEQRGVLCIDAAAQAQANDCVLIRAHGIPRQEESVLHCGQILVVDATCPKVKKAQLAIAKATATDGFLLLFGEGNHPEVRGLVSYAKNGAYVFDNIEGLKKYNLHTHKNYVLASQTTQDRVVFDNIESYLRSQHPSVTVLSTICDATRHRQHEAVEIASKVDCMVVVGGRESGNTRRLADVASACGIPTWHVESVEELDVNNFAEKHSVGLTAGASTPKSLIDSTQIFLESV